MQAFGENGQEAFEALDALRFTQIQVLGQYSTSVVLGKYLASVTAALGALRFTQI